MAIAIEEFDAYLAKPIDPFELVEAVARVVGRGGEPMSSRP